MADVPVEQVRALLRELHGGVSQEAAAARIALAVWRRAADAVAAQVAAKEAEARLEALFDRLAALEARGKEMVAAAESASPTKPAQ